MCKIYIYIWEQYVLEIRGKKALRIIWRRTRRKKERKRTRCVCTQNIDMRRHNHTEKMKDGQSNNRRWQYNTAQEATRRDAGGTDLQRCVDVN